MRPHPRHRLVPLCAVVLGALGCEAPPPVTAPPVMFRADARHSGTFETTVPAEAPGLLWRFQTGGPVWSSPVVSDGTVYVGSADGGLYALDADSGARRWHADVGSPVGSTPAVAGGAVIFTSRDGVVHALDAESGEVRWRVETGALLPWTWGFEGWDLYLSSPVVQDSLVIVGAGDGAIYALTLEGGEETWRFQTEGRIRSTPAIADGTVFAGSTDGRVYALALADGSERWRHETDGAARVSADEGVDRVSIIASPLVAGGTVFVGSRDGFMYALDQETGARRWQVSHEGSWAMSSPTVDGRALFEGTSDGAFVHRVDVETGEEEWRFPADGYTWSSPALVGSTVLIGDAGGHLRALDAATGDERWSFSAGGGVYSSPWVDGDVIYFGADDGGVYAVGGGAPRVHRAVFWDEEMTGSAFAPHLEPRVHFAAHGYDVLDSEALEAFLAARVEDGARSVVVFALDRLPDAVAADAADTVLFRRYLDAGGKAVWLGLPPQSLSRNEAGQLYFDREGPERLLGVDYGEANFDYYGTLPTALGRSWGLEYGWVATFSVEAGEDLQVLALDENGRAAAWVRAYGGPPGSGFVGMGLHRLTPRVLDAVLSVAEYGLGEPRP